MSEPHDPHDPRDPELERIYRAAGGEEPPSHLDDAILAAARRSVASRPKPMRVAMRQWGPPVALAATLLLAVTLSLMVFEEQKELDIEKAAQAPSKPAPVQRQEPPSEFAGKREQASPPRSELSRSREESARSDRPAVAQPAPRPDAASQAEISGPAVPAEQAQPSPAAAPSAPPAELMRSRDAAPGRPSANDARTVPSPAPSPQNVPLGARLGERREASGAAKAPELAAAGAERRTPEQWVELIRKLKAGGKSEEAQRELEALKREHPAYRLPDDLTRP